MPTRQSASFALILVLSLLFGLIVPARVSSAAPTCVKRVVESLNPSGDGSTWAMAYTDLKLAITSAVSGCEVWVAEGVYTPGINPLDSFSLKNGVAIYGGFEGTETERTQRNWKENISVLDGGDLVYHVVNNVSISPTGVLDGFTIRNGNATGPLSADGRGGGVYNYLSSPIFSNLTISGNTASTGGGMFNYNGVPSLTNVIFSGNTAGYGGGMYNAFSNPIVINVTFSGNSAEHQGGGMMNDMSSPTLTNVTIAGNSAVEIGGGMYNYYSAALIYNSIVWDNTGGGANAVGSGVPTFTNSLVQGCIVNTIWQSSCGNNGADNLGGNNLDADPLFIDADGPDNTFGTADDNPRLQKTSPAFNTGSDSFLTADPLDLDGDGNTTELIPFDLDNRPRILGAHVDMGAYESDNDWIFLPYVTK